MTTFDKREEGFEKKFALDEELKFKAEARRNKLLGLWVANRQGLSADAASAYGLKPTLVIADEFAQWPETRNAQRVWSAVLSSAHKVAGCKLVILTSAGPVIIDWEGAARGPGMYDVAMTWVIIAFSRIPGSRIRAAALRGVQRLFTWSFVRVADPIDQFMRTAAIRRRLADPHLLPAEAARMERLVRG